MRIAGRLELGVPLLIDALDIAEGKQTVQAVLVVHHQEFMNAGMLVEKFVRANDGSRPSSFLLMVWTWERGVSASAIFFFAYRGLTTWLGSRPTSFP